MQRNNQSSALVEAAEVGVKWPKAQKDALAALATAQERYAQARAMAAVGRKALDEEWLADKAAHDIEQAKSKAPADFEPFRTPRPDVGYLQDIEKAYGDARHAAQREVDAVFADYGKLHALLDRAWVALPSVKPDTMTVAEAAGVEAQRNAGRSILRAANLALGRAAGMTDKERKAMLTQASRDPERLPNLNTIIAEATGQDAASIDRARKTAARKAAEQARITSEARLAARARTRQPEKVEMHSGLPGDEGLPE